MIHSFCVDFAFKYSIEAAIIIDQLYWWLHKNACEEEYIKDGRVWCYFSARGLAKYITYMNSQKLRRELRKLEDDEIIMSGNFNKNPTNQTLWYTFTDSFLSILNDANYDVSHFSKMNNGMFKNEKCNKTIINNNLIEDNIIEENKSVSNDTQKVFPDIFDFFWENYNYKKGKEAAKRAWKRLSAEEKELAINAIEEYKRDCKRNQRHMKHSATYINQKTWNDDFSNDGKLSNLCYDVDPDDDDKVRRFKEWMRRKHPEIEFTEKPLTFEGYMRLQDAYGMDEVCDQLDYIDANIGKYRQCDIEAIIRRYFEKQ